MGLELGTPKMPKRNDEETHDFLGPGPIQRASVEFFLAIESFSSPGLAFAFSTKIRGNLCWRLVDLCVFASKTSYLCIYHWQTAQGQSHPWTDASWVDGAEVAKQRAGGWKLREIGWSCTVQAMFKLILVWFPDKCACSWTGNGKQINTFILCAISATVRGLRRCNFVPETLHFFPQTVYCLGFSMLS